MHNLCFSFTKLMLATFTKYTMWKYEIKLKKKTQSSYSNKIVDVGYWMGTPTHDELNCITLEISSAALWNWGNDIEHLHCSNLNAHMNSGANEVCTYTEGDGLMCKHPFLVAVHLKVGARFSVHTCTRAVLVSIHRCPTFLFFLIFFTEVRPRGAASSSPSCGF
jgi:hypothetical protein